MGYCKSPQNTLTPIRSMLSGADLRSVGRVAEVIDLLRARPAETPHLIECLFDQDACVRMRAADALEKLSRDREFPLQEHKRPLLWLFARTKQQEVKWHLAVIVPRLRLTPAECRSAAATLESFLGDKSSILKTYAMQGLADLAERRDWLRPPVVDLIRTLTRTGTPAMQARGRKLLHNLECAMPRTVARASE